MFELRTILLNEGCWTFAGLEQLFRTFSHPRQNNMFPGHDVIVGHSRTSQYIAGVIDIDILGMHTYRELSIYLMP